MYFPIFWGHFISKIALLLQYLIRIAFLGGSLLVNLSFTSKDPPKTPIRDTYYSDKIAIAILPIKCPQQIRKYVVDTSLEFKYSLANNG